MIEVRPHDVRHHFAQRLKELRAVRGFRTARSLAHALDIDENRYTRYERAEVEPDLALLMRICAALRATPNDLLMGWPQPGPDRSLEGFAEKADSAGGEAGLASADADRNERRGRVRALAWRLASEVVSWRAKPEPPLTALRTKFRLFAEIERDPFSFIGRLAEEPGLAELDPQAQTRLAALIDDLVAAVSGGHLA